MNYSNIYMSIIEKAKMLNRSLKDEVYYENHHIIPKCIGGTNEAENKVLLTAREHFLCHWLLAKIHKDDHKIIFAWNAFCMSTHKGNRPTSHLYEYTRKVYCKMMKDRIKAKDFIPHSPKGLLWLKKEDICIRVPEERIENYLSEGWIKGRIIKYRKPHSKETKEKISAANKGHKVSEKTKKIHSSNSKNKVWITNLNLNICKMIKDNKISLYLNSGWVLGRLLKQQILTEDKRKQLSDQSKKEYIIIYPNGLEVKIKGLADFCKKHNLNPSSMHKVHTGKLKNHKGFVCKKI